MPRVIENSFANKGEWGVTKHSNVLSALEKRALRYRSKGQKEVDQDEVLYNEALDETVVSMSSNRLD